jgi:hypothetical protein
MKYDYTKQSEVKRAFWVGLEQFKKRGYKHNDYNATIRSEFSEFVDMLRRNEHISEALAQKVTLD